MAFQLGSVVATITANVDNFKKGMQTVKDETSEASTKMSNFSNVMKGAVVAGSAIAAAGIIALGKSALDAAADFEQTKISFEVMLGSAAKAQKLLKDLQDFAKKTPFNLVELQDSTKRLLAYGISGDKVIDTMRTLGNITSAVGRDKMPQLILAFGQVKAAGKLMGTELRQFTETGVPLLQVLADQFGVTTGEIQQMVSDGKIGFADVQKALESLGGEGGKWGDMMDRQSKTFAGSMSNLQDSWNQLLVVLGTVFIPIATEAVQALTGFLTPIMDVANGTKSLEEAFGLSSEQAKLFKDVLAEFQSFLTNTLMPAVQVVVAFMSEQWRLHKDEFFAVWQIIWGIIQVAWSLIYGLIKVGLELLAGDWQGAWDAIKQMTDLGWAGVKNIFGGALNFIKSWGSQVLDFLVSPFQAAWSKISDLMNKIKDAADPNKRHSPSMVDLVERGVRDLNSAWSSLAMPVPTMQHAPALSPMTGGGSLANVAISVDMSNAIISDQLSAQRMGEKIGDAIIGKLKTNVRF